MILGRTLLVLITGWIFALASVPGHAQGVPGVDTNKCLAGKTQCVSKKIAGLLKCRQKCQKNPSKCGNEQAACEAKVMEKFYGGYGDPAKGCFAKMEAKENPSKPSSICTTTDDIVAMGAGVDDAAAELLARLERGAPTCGDGVVNVAGEHCDGPDTGGVTCATLTRGRYIDNEVRCNDDCTFDARDCIFGTECVSRGGVPVDGACWFLGLPDADCHFTCQFAGLSCDEVATRDIAGSGGDDSRCNSVLDALGVPGPPIVSPFRPPLPLDQCDPILAGAGICHHFAEADVGCSYEGTSFTPPGTPPSPIGRMRVTSPRTTCGGRLVWRCQTPENTGGPTCRELLPDFDFSSFGAQRACACIVDD